MASKSDSSKNSRGRRFRDTARELIVRWRYRGHTGRLIRRHRALRSLDVQTSSVTHPLGLTVASLAAVISLRDVIAATWADIITFWCNSTGIDIATSMRPVSAAGAFAYSIPEFRLVSPLPGDDVMVGSLVLVLVALLVSYVALRRFLPIVYLVWAIGVIQLSAIATFYFSSTAFPYTIGAHVSSSLEVTLMLLMMIPLMLMVSYYPLNFSLWKKLALTLFILVMVFLFAPHLYACHIVMMSFYSVLYMPVLFAVFGTLPIMVMIIAIYGWGMSWEQQRQ